MDSKNSSVSNKMLKYKQVTFSLENTTSLYPCHYSIVKYLQVSDSLVVNFF